MKRIITTIILGVLMTSCSQQYTSQPKVSNVKSNVTYFKDERVGLCFGAINSQTSDLLLVTSITCVPCDSVKNLITQ